MYLILPIFLLAILSSILFLHVRKKRISSKLSRLAIEERIRLLNELVKPYGLAYDLAKDIFSLTTNTSFTHCPITTDFESISFAYDEHNWMLRLWKGQCGIMMCAGLQLSHTESAISTEDLPLCSYTLYKGIVPVYQIRMQRNCQIAGFCTGRYCEPELLRMDLTMTFKNSDMANAFITGLKQSGYRTSQFDSCLCVVSFRFYSPATTQPRQVHPFAAHLRLWQDRIYLYLYRIATHPSHNTTDQLLLLHALFPSAFKRIFSCLQD